MANIDKKRKFSAADLAKCALFVVLMIVSAYISVPFIPMPLTFQTAICVLAMLLLGARRAALAMGCYLVLGIIGVPVFSKGGGFWYVSEPSFGYIIGYVVSVLVAGFVVRYDKKITFKRAFFASLLAVAIDYFIGIVYFSIIWKLVLKSSGLLFAVLTYNLSFIIKDIALCAIASFIAVKTLPLLKGKLNK